MNLRTIPLLIAFVFAPVVFIKAGETSAPASAGAQAWWAHVQALADDAMEGRLTGSAGMRAAQTYVVAQLRDLGLEPAGENGFLQTVELLKREIDESRSSAALIRESQLEPLELGPDAFFNLRAPVASAQEIEAPLVFVGNALRVPEVGHDDFAGVDLKNKIAVFIAGSPETVSTPLAGHYNSAAERARILQETGALGFILIPNPSAMDVPWVRSMAFRTAPAMDFTDPAMQENAGLRIALTWNPAQAEKLFAGSAHTFRELAQMAGERVALPRFPLAVALRARAAIRETSLSCANVIARLPGSDAALRDEYVVLTGHLDHHGIGVAVDGDAINNGAMDNASGVAALLEVAKTLRSRATPLRRSVLFAFVTGEEKGLIGSKFFTRRPTVPAAAMIANVNLDMFLPIIPLTKLKIGGLDESDLGDRARDVATTLGIEPIADPEPLRSLFIRSDQYSFVLLGIPAMKPDFGYALGSPEHQVVKDWLKQRYHAPSDDLAQPVDFEAADRYLEFVRELVTRLANDDARPHWKAESFFRRYAQ